MTLWHRRDPALDELDPDLLVPCRHPQPHYQGHRLNVTQITHHDLDGYGAATVVASFVEVGRLIHVSRYADVAPVVEGEIKRLRRAAEAEMVIITDLGLEAGTVKFIKSFAAMNLGRDEVARHRLLVLD